MKWRKLPFRTILATCLFLSLLTVLPAPCLSQPSPAFDRERMNRDLEIMEGILDRMLRNGPRPFPGLLSERGSRGSYLPDYGVIFVVNLEDRFEMRLLAPEIDFSFTDGPGETHERQVSVVHRNKVVAEKHEADASRPEERLTTLKNDLMDFFGSYADAIGQLKPDERIMVVVQLNESDPTASAAISKADILYIQASLTRADLTKFKRGESGGKKLREVIRFHEIPASEEMGKELAVMTSIFRTGLSRRYNPDFGVSRVSGFYTDAMGAIFLVDGDLENPDYTFLYKIDSKSSQVKSQKLASRRETSSAVAAQKFREELTRLVADFGPAMKLLPSDKHFVVSVELAGAAKGQVSLLLMASKGDLDAYARGAITLAELRNRIRWNEF